MLSFLFFCHVLALALVATAAQDGTIVDEVKEGGTCANLAVNDNSAMLENVLNISASLCESLESLEKLRRLVDEGRERGARALTREEVMEAFDVSTPEKEILRNVTNFINALLRMSRSGVGDVDSGYDEILVIGAGPVGLINSLVAWLSTPWSTSVKIYEKRPSSFDRDIWFDVASANLNALSNNHESLGFLRSLGLEYFPNLNSTVHSNLDGKGGEIVSLPCSGLQKFLLKVLVVLGVDMQFGVSNAEIDEILAENRDQKRDLLIIADGAKGEVSRGKLGLKDADSPKVIIEGINFGTAEPHETLIANLRPR